MGLHPWRGGLRGSEPCKGLAHISAQQTHLTFVDRAFAHTRVCVCACVHARVHMDAQSRSVNLGCV